MKLLLRLAVGVLVLVVLLIGGVWLRYGGGDPSFVDRTSAPELPASSLEGVADLDLPPGNIAVSASGRIFFTFHPEGSPRVKVAELVDGNPIPYPSASAQEGFESVLSLRIDRQNRLWTLDNANHGTGQPRLMAFDLSTNGEIFRHDFPPEIAGLGSHLNDFQVAPDGERIYIADASIFAKNPAIIVFDIERGESRRLLEEHRGVTPEMYIPVVDGRKMVVFGIFAIRPGVDSIALDRRGEWLYFAPVTSNHMYRVRRRYLDDTRLGAEALAAHVERFAEKTMSDGITTDLRDNVYLSDLEHSAIVRLGSNRQLETLLKDPRLRWPDGFSFGPEGWLYVTCSSLHQVIGKSAAEIRAQRPYQIFRFRTGVDGVPGH
jgi:sugar lactone lactonase YvrE